MFEVYDRIFVGAEGTCRQGQGDLAVVHACKTPCHCRAVGYSGSLSKTHPNYLVLERGNDLYLNMIDPDAPLFMAPTFTTFLKFAEEHWKEGRRILIHCNQGLSRAPSLAMLFLAKRRGAISNDSFDAAKHDFAAMYRAYSPGGGIVKYLRTHWVELDNL